MTNLRKSPSGKLQSIPTLFTELSDAPETLEGQEGKILQVVSGPVVGLIPSTDSEVIPLPNFDGNPAIIGVSSWSYLRLNKSLVFSLAIAIDFAVLGAKAAGAPLFNFYVPPFFDGDTETAGGYTSGVLRWTGGRAAIVIQSFSAGVISTLDATPGVGDGTAAFTMCVQKP